MQLVCICMYWFTLKLEIVFSKKNSHSCLLIIFFNQITFLFLYPSDFFSDCIWLINIQKTFCERNLVLFTLACSLYTISTIFLALGDLFMNILDKRSCFRCVFKNEISKSRKKWNRSVLIKKLFICTNAWVCFDVLSVICIFANANVGRKCILLFL